jgi:hypothetical protein
MLDTICMGGGQAEFDVAAGSGRLVVPATAGRQYVNAQVDDYHPARRGRRISRRHFRSAPPLRLALRARASHPAPVGTLGFGFWNEPFSVSGSVLSTPNAIWFFYASAPSDMALAQGVPGRGWKAATLNTGRLPGLVIAPAALAAIALTRVPGLGRPVMSLARRFAAASEAMLNVALDEWHAYELDWREGEALFLVDGAEKLRSPAPLRGPLGFVMWIDNQYAIASEDGRFGFGVQSLPEAQWLEIADFRLDRSPAVV